MVWKSGQISLPFCQGSRVWRTDGRTDRRTNGHTEISSLYRVCITCSAVIKRFLPLSGDVKSRPWHGGQSLASALALKAVTLTLVYMSLLAEISWNLNFDWQVGQLRLTVCRVVCLCPTAQDTGMGTRRKSSRPRRSPPETETRPRRWLHQPRRDVNISRRDVCSSRDVIETLK